MKYNTRTFLNQTDSPSTGSIVCFDGRIKWSMKQNEPERTSFVEIADCQVKVRLHRTCEDRAEDFIEKIKKMEKDLVSFREHLEKAL